jgi:hypothetical protein
MTAMKNEDEDVGECALVGGIAAGGGALVHDEGTLAFKWRGNARFGITCTPQSRQKWTFLR